MSDVIHLITKYLNEVNAGVEQKEAMKRTLDEIGSSYLFNEPYYSHRFCLSDCIPHPSHTGVRFLRSNRSFVYLHYIYRHHPQCHYAASSGALSAQKVYGKSSCLESDSLKGLSTHFI